MSEPGDDRHSHWQEMLLDALDGALAPAEQRELESHLASCTSCAALRRELDLVDRSLRERLRAPSLGVAFDERLLLQIRAMNVGDPAALQARRERQRQAVRSQFETSLRSVRRLLVANLVAVISVLVALLLARLNASPDAFLVLRRGYEGILEQLPQQPVLTTALALAAVVLALSTARAQR